MFLINRDPCGTVSEEPMNAMRPVNLVAATCVSLLLLAVGLTPATANTTDGVTYVEKNFAHWSPIQYYITNYKDNAMSKGYPYGTEYDQGGCYRITLAQKATDFGYADSVELYRNGFTASKPRYGEHGCTPITHIGIYNAYDYVYRPSVDGSEVITYSITSKNGKKVQYGTISFTTKGLRNFTFKPVAGGMRFYNPNDVKLYLGLSGDGGEQDIDLWIQPKSSYLFRTKTTKRVTFSNKTISGRVSQGYVAGYPLPATAASKKAAAAIAAAAKVKKATKVQVTKNTTAQRIKLVLTNKNKKTAKITITYNVKRSGKIVTKKVVRSVKSGKKRSVTLKRVEPGKAVVVKSKVKGIKKVTVKRFRL